MATLESITFCFGCGHSVNDAMIIKKTQILLSLRPPYPPTYTLPIYNFTFIILMADSHKIQNGKIYINCRLLFNHIVCKITQKQHEESKHL